MAELVKLRHFAGLSLEQTAEALGVSARTVRRHWAFARAWLLRELSDATAKFECCASAAPGHSIHRGTPLGTPDWERDTGG